MIIHFVNEWINMSSSQVEDDSQKTNQQSVWKSLVNNVSQYAKDIMEGKTASIIVNNKWIKIMSLSEVYQE